MPQQRDTTDRILLIAVWAASVLALIAGAALFFGDLSTGGSTSDGGWYACQPLADSCTELTPRAALSATGVFGLVAMLLGLAGTCLLIGRTLGLREGRRRTQEAAAPSSHPGGTDRA